MFRLLFQLVKWIFVLAVGLTLLFVFRHAVAGQIVRWTAASTVGLPFEMQKFEVTSLYPFHGSGTGFLWKNPPDFPHPRALSGPRLLLDLGTRGWSEGAFRVQSLHLDFDELTIVISASGESNLSRVPALSPGASSASWLTRNIVVAEPSFSMKRVLLIDYRSGPNTLPISYRAFVLNEALARNQPLASLPRVITERILARTPLKLDRFVKSVK